MRERLIKVAIDHFGQHGFEGVGTRQIAAEADTAMSSITYHFGGKEGLYRAAAEHIVGHMRDVVLKPPINQPGPQASNIERIEAVCTVLGRIGAMMLRDDTASFALFMAREQQSPSPIMRELLGENMMLMMRMVVNQIAKVRPDLSADEHRATALYMFGMTISLRHMRASLHMLLENETIDEPTRDMLLARLDAVIREILSGGAK